MLEMSHECSRKKTGNIAIPHPSMVSAAPASSTTSLSNIRKKSNLINVRGTSLIFDEIQVAKEEENQIQSLDEIEEEDENDSDR